ncbi:hypothetical protein DM860_016853 [Cuscuta australis]|uniref:Uncharacterized protein n=1 Tax=Cuscuta australis TaxID=267555 RepID=A0A328DYS4_9ASTE|nr:hypothetical protein DM860_016853 [Cuscuta australis]
MSCGQDCFLKLALGLDVLASILAIVAELGKNKTVKGDYCGAVTFQPTIAAAGAYGAMVCALLALISGMTYFECHPSTGKETRRNVALCFTAVPFVAALVFLYKGMGYTKKMGGGGGGGDSLPSVCVISHPLYLYITTGLCGLHFLVLWAGVSWTEEQTAQSSGSGLQMPTLN